VTALLTVGSICCPGLCLPATSGDTRVTSVGLTPCPARYHLLGLVKLLMGCQGGLVTSEAGTCLVQGLGPLNPPPPGASQGKIDWGFLWAPCDFQLCHYLALQLPPVPGPWRQWVWQLLRHTSQGGRFPTGSPRRDSRLPKFWQVLL
jgi:hypothetical protein